MDISVVVPVFNAAITIEKLTTRLIAVLELTGKSFEIIFVDDASHDKSWQEICQQKNKFPAVKGIRLGRNFGQHNATLCGITRATGKFIITIDDDLEIAPEDIPLLIKKQEETDADLVYGSFTNRGKKPIRYVLTGFYKLLSRLVEGKGRGKGSSFRLITRQLADLLITHTYEFVFIDEVCLWHTENLAFVPIKKYPAQGGKSRYSLFNLSLISGELMIFSSVFLLRIVTYAGVSLTFINFLLGLYFIIRKIFFSIDVEGYTSLIVSILFSSGLILLLLGIIAQYLSKILMSQYRKPSFSIRNEV